jgi:hypothetical protein
MTESETTPIAQFEGSGARNTKPFQIPEDAQFFTIRWNFNGESGEIGIHSVANPSDLLDSISSDSSGESVFYGSGTFFFSVNSSTRWIIDVEIENDAWLDEEDPVGENELVAGVQEQSFRDPRWRPASMAFGDWYFVYATYEKEIVDQIRLNSSLNFADDLERGFIIDETGQVRLELDRSSAGKIRTLVLDLDQVMRNVVPDIQDNYPNGVPTPIHHLDERRLTKAQKQGLKLHLSISNVLRKRGSSATFYFGSGVRRLQFVRVSSHHSVNHRLVSQNAAANQWEQFFGPRRTASAWFDEASRRGR